MKNQIRKFNKAIFLLIKPVFQDIYNVFENQYFEKSYENKMNNNNLIVIERKFVII